MQLWRLYRQSHGPGLDGAGGLHTAGRWHELGTPVVYFGASPAIVVLEKLAHIDPDVLPSDLMLGCFEGELTVEELKDFHDLHDIAKTQQRGEAFFRARTACVLRVPSVVLPEERNFVFNPLHPEAPNAQLTSARPFSFDDRLL